MSSTQFCPATFEDDDEHILRSAENILNCDYADSDRGPRYPAGLPFMRQSSQGEQYYDYENYGMGNVYYPNQYQNTYADSFRGYQKNITTGEKLNQMMEDQHVKHALLNSALGKGSHKQLGPILKLSVYSAENTDYELDQSDIIEVFSRYGRIAQVLLLNQGKAIIVFQDLISAAFAQKSLNGHFINDICVRLIVDWATANDLRDVRSYLVVPTHEEKSFQGPPPGYQPHPQQPLGLSVQYLGHGAQQQMSLQQQVPIQPQMPIQPQQYIVSQPQNGGSQMTSSGGLLHDKEELEPKFQTNFPMKFTCRYEIQIENDKEFQVARKIIGSKGYNMKRIIDLCLKEATSEMRASVDAVKLRLRGRGSGYKEGPDKQESQEPLHLCVSSRFNEVYAIACKLVEELLKNIYDDYENFKARIGRHTEEPLSIKKIECPGGKNPQQVQQAVSTSSYPLQLGSQLQQQQQHQALQHAQSSSSASHNSSGCGQAKKAASGSGSSSGYQNYNQNFPCLQSTISSSSSSSSQSINSATTSKPSSSESVGQAFGEGQIKKKKSPSPTREGACSSEYDRDMKKKTIKEKSKRNGGYCANGNGSPLNSGEDCSFNCGSSKDSNGEKGYKYEGVELNEAEIKKYVEARNKARRELKFEEADRIRNFLKQKGVALMDEKGGRGKGSEVTTWKFCKKEATRGANN